MLRNGQINCGRKSIFSKIVYLIKIDKLFI